MVMIITVLAYAFVGDRGYQVATAAGLSRIVGGGVCKCRWWINVITVSTVDEPIIGVRLEQ